jgi:hypothetical protein
MTISHLLTQHILLHKHKADSPVGVEIESTERTIDLATGHVDEWSVSVGYKLNREPSFSFEEATCLHFCLRLLAYLANSNRLYILCQVMYSGWMHSHRSRLAKDINWVARHSTQKSAPWSSLCLLDRVINCMMICVLYSISILNNQTK